LVFCILRFSSLMRLVRGTQLEVGRLFFIQNILDGSDFREFDPSFFLKGFRFAYAASSCANSWAVRALMGAFVRLTVIREGAGVSLAGTAERSMNSRTSDNRKRTERHPNL
jgi:hypothetical protein